MMVTVSRQGTGNAQPEVFTFLVEDIVRETVAAVLPVSESVWSLPRVDIYAKEMQMPRDSGRRPVEVKRRAIGGKCGKRGRRLSTHFTHPMGPYGQKKTGEGFSRTDEMAEREEPLSVSDIEAGFGEGCGGVVLAY